MKFLVVDDSSTMRRIILNTLKRLDYTDVLQAADGEEAWIILKDSLNYEKIDVLITDQNMPNMTGYELVLKVKENKKFDDMPIIMVTTEGGKAEVIKALKAGVNNYIVKPFTPQVLKDKLAAVLGYT